MTEIANLPFWELVYDGDGHPDGDAEATFLREAREKGITDVVVFSHGWNSNRTAATRLYNGFFSTLARQLRHVPAGQDTKVGLVGVMWPSQRWSDEPIPDFEGPSAAGGGGGGTRLPEAAGERPWVVLLSPWARCRCRPSSTRGRSPR